MPETVRNAVFGNVGTTITFRVGPFDAEVLEKIFSPKFTAEDIVNLGFAQIYLTLMIDGVGSQPFSAKTMPPIPIPKEKYTDEIIKHSRDFYAKPRDDVEKEISKWHEAETPEESFEKPTTNKDGYQKGVYIKRDNMVKKDFFPPRVGYEKKPAVFEKNNNTNFTSPEKKRASLGDEIKKAIIEKEKSVDLASGNETRPKEESKISLSALKPVTVTDKKSTGKNLGGLKDILAKAVQKKDKTFSLGNVSIKKEVSVAEPLEKIIPNHTDKLVQDDKKEVPEDVLRKLLNTEE